MENAAAHARQRDREPTLWYRSPTGAEPEDDAKGRLHAEEDQDTPAWHPPQGTLVPRDKNDPGQNGEIQIKRGRAERCWRPTYVARTIERWQSETRLPESGTTGQRASLLLDLFIQGCRNESKRPGWCREADSRPNLKEAGLTLWIQPRFACHHPDWFPRESCVRIGEASTDGEILVTALGVRPPDVWVRTKREPQWRGMHCYPDDAAQAIAHAIDPESGHRPAAPEVDLLIACSRIEHDPLDASKPVATVTTADRDGRHERELTGRQLRSVLTNTFQASRIGPSSNGWILDLTEPAGHQCVLYDGQHRLRNTTTWWTPGDPFAAACTGAPRGADAREAAQSLIERLLSDQERLGGNRDQEPVKLLGIEPISPPVVE